MLICGIDEAGRGSLCGSLFVAGLACEQSQINYLQTLGVKDSKKLARTTRFGIAKELKNSNNFHIHIAQKTSNEIDKFGLSLCLRQSIEEIINALSVFSKEFYMDGNTLFGLTSTPDYRLHSIVKGDDKIPQISAASIIAKVSKDTEMLELDTAYPQYGFKNNCGYGTKEHIMAIDIYGQTPFHRKSFVLQKRLFE